MNVYKPLITMELIFLRKQKKFWFMIFWILIAHQIIMLLKGCINLKYKLKIIDLEFLHSTSKSFWQN